MRRCKTTSSCTRHWAEAGSRKRSKREGRDQEAFDYIRRKNPEPSERDHYDRLVQNHFEFKGQTLYIGHPFYRKYDTAPIKLQAHGDHSEPISFRNIWVRELN